MTTRRLRTTRRSRRLTSACLLVLAVMAGTAAPAVVRGQQQAASALPAKLRPPALTDVELPDAAVGSVYNISVGTSGGALPYTMLISGNLPAGLIVDAGNGTVDLRGVPANAGSYELRVTVTDNNGITSSRTYPLNVVHNSSSPEAFVTDTEGFKFSDLDSVFFPTVIPTVYEHFSFTDTDNIFFPAIVSDTTEMFTFKDVDDVFFPSQAKDNPDGFKFGDTVTVLPSAMPTDNDGFKFADTDTVITKVGILPATAPAGTYNTSYSQVFTASGNTGTATLTPSGTIPGLSFSTSGGTTTLSGTPTTPGTYSFTITAHDTTNTSVVSYSLTINPASQTINVGTLPAPTYGGSAFSLTGDLTASSGLTPSIALNSGPVTGSGFGPYTITGAGTASFTATQTGNTDYAAASAVNFNISIAKATLGVAATSTSRAFDQPNPSFGYTFGSFVNGDTASVVSGTPTFFNLATPLSPVSGSPYSIGLQRGTLAAANYTFAFSLGATLTVTPAAQSITFYPLPNITHGTTFPLSARASSGLAVTYTVSGPASITNNILSVTGPGAVQITAAQTGNGNYNAATSIVRSFIAQ